MRDALRRSSSRRSGKFTATVLAFSLLSLSLPSLMAIGSSRANETPLDPGRGRVLRNPHPSCPRRALLLLPLGRRRLAEGGFPSRLGRALPPRRPRRSGDRARQPRRQHAHFGAEVRIVRNAAVGQTSRRCHRRLRAVGRDGRARPACRACRQRTPAGHRRS